MSKKIRILVARDARFATYSWSDARALLRSHVSRAMTNLYREERQTCLNALRHAQRRFRTMGGVRRMGSAMAFALTRWSGACCWAPDRRSRHLVPPFPGQRSANGPHVINSGRAVSPTAKAP